MDDDGHVDVLAWPRVSGQADSIRWYRNTGADPVTFEAPVLIGSELFSRVDVAAADFNEDGAQDVLSVSTAGLKIHLSSGGAQPQFGELDFGEVVRQERELTVIDAENDGDLDVFLWDIDDEGWLLGENLGGATPQMRFRMIDPQPDRIGGATFADLDGDGDADVVVSDTANQRLIWYERISNVPGDLNGDHSVGVADLAFLLGSWGPHEARSPADLTADGVVDAKDLSVLLGSWSSLSAQ